jgi:hypothetical protein
MTARRTVTAVAEVVRPRVVAATAMAALAVSCRGSGLRSYYGVGRRDVATDVRAAYISP